MTKKSGVFRTLAVLAAVIIGGSVSAATIDVYNTGVDASGAVVANGTLGDQHYRLVEVPGGSTRTIKAGDSTGGYPIGPWVGDNTLSRWIGPNTTSFNGPSGFYRFRTTFDLTGMIASTASLAGRWAFDDASSVFLNGNRITFSNSLHRWNSLNITTGFVDGLNELDFLVYNTGGPIGVRVELSGTADMAPAPVPLPAGFPLMLAGLGAFAAVRRRRKA